MEWNWSKSKHVIVLEIIYLYIYIYVYKYICLKGVHKDCYICKKIICDKPIDLIWKLHG